ncbi:MAG: alpha/beta fold hydrolase [Parachlamydiales bacterium]|nr:alpha/beta fold hydrolase [Parachlamydiales bacterium]
MKKLLILLILFIGANATSERFIESEGAQIFCRSAGKGNPLIVIHGGPGLSQDYLLPELYELAENNFVIFYDQRGAGNSTGKIDQTLNLAALIRDLDHLRLTFGLEKVSLLGHSWGGLVAMQYAVDHPESIEKLILSNPAPASTKDFAKFEEEYIRRTTPLQEEINHILMSPEYANGNPETHEFLNRMIFCTFCHKAEDANLINLTMSQTAWTNCIKINPTLWGSTLIESFDLHDRLKKLSIPTLIIHGDDDPIPLVVVQHIHESIPDSKLIVLENCGHFPYLEKKEPYFKALKEFLNDNL